jgi:hypothetical protein
MKSNNFPLFVPFGKHSIPLQVLEVQTSKPSFMVFNGPYFLAFSFFARSHFDWPITTKKIMPKIESLFIMILLKAILNPKYSIQVILQLPVSGFFKGFLFVVQVANIHRKM